MSSLDYLEILDKLAEARDALRLVELAAGGLRSDDSSPLVVGCSFVAGFLAEARAMIESPQPEDAS